MNDKLKLLTKKKQQLDALRPLPKELIKNLEEWFRVELTYSSNAIEGNTLTRLETAEVIKKSVLAAKQSLNAHIKAAKGEQAVVSIKTKEPETLLKIGELAKRTNETVHTLRFWTLAGLLKATGHTEGGYLLYSPTMIDRVKEIRRLQVQERLTLKEIKERL